MTKNPINTDKKLPRIEPDWMKDLDQPAELDPELKACIIKHRGHAFLKHPLVNLPVADGYIWINIANHQLKQKKEWLAEAIAKGDFAEAVFLHERHCRMDYVLQLAH